MSKKPYSPVAGYSDLKRVESEIDKAQSVDDLRKIVVKDGPKVGYKAFCYMLGGKMTPEGMKPDEACVAAATLEQKGEAEQAMAIYKRVLDVYPDHAIAKSKVSS
ncbi:MAG: hypothetical protein H6631_15095 [Anaerolineaceae bacterium]|nr:hypothetical protein [Anaerolineaceae bacterium]MCB9099314.1 hypothetical protein [Anaerolineales bacterium]